jgi:replication-associated recombination protein RarA
MTPKPFELRTQNHYVFMEVVSALQKEIRRGNEVNALYWAYELIPQYETYLWKRLKVIVNEDIGIANPQLIVQIQVLTEQYYEMREKATGTSFLMCLTNAIVLMCRSPKSRIADHLSIIMRQTKAVQAEVGPEFDRKKWMQIPDYALDKHTSRGRAMKRSFDHFRKEGALLNNCSIPDPYEDEAYECLKNKKTWPVPGRSHVSDAANPEKAQQLTFGGEGDE